MQTLESKVESGPKQVLNNLTFSEFEIFFSEFKHFLKFLNLSFQFQSKNTPENKHMSKRKIKTKRQ